ncbi:hypothetical protein BN1184_AP_00550 [Pantoea ananatis]|nr:hypothetical protein BN1182_AV_00560 [Pantoea ananatis]CRH37463.1 hypothetical protein BN1184_AP_00550 [Pantoea ananatis]
MGCRDSNPGMLVSETSALPLGRHPNGVKSNCLKMAGVQGFEPRNAGIRNQCLTAWRHPKKMVATTGIEPVTPAL